MQCSGVRRLPAGWPARSTRWQQGRLCRNCSCDRSADRDVGWSRIERGRLSSGARRPVAILRDGAD